MEYGFKPTTNGRALIAACGALEQPLKLTRVTFGSGLVSEGTNLADQHQLVTHVLGDNHRQPLEGATQQGHVRVFLLTQRIFTHGQCQGIGAGHQPDRTGGLQVCCHKLSKRSLCIRIRVTG